MNLEIESEKLELNMNDIKYQNGKFNFAYRVSALIFDKEKTKILLFHGKNNNFYMLPGGKVKELEESHVAIKREIEEELGWRDLEFDFLGVSEEIIKSEDRNIHQLTLTYKSTYNDIVSNEKFESIESDWINFKWVKIAEIDKYEIHPTKITNFIKDNGKITHIIDNNYRK